MKLKNRISKLPAIKKEDRYRENVAFLCSGRIDKRHLPTIWHTAPCQNISIKICTFIRRSASSGGWKVTFGKIKLQ